jgi:hypothetical protein
MPSLVWDKTGDKIYETGLDKGVLYLPDGTAVPWNGLTSVIESFDKETSPVYYDGMKINDLVSLGDFSATMKALTYPEEFSELEGLGKKRAGLFLADQIPKVFCLSYRTLIGNDIVGDTAGYKIHILYNVTAIPNDKEYATLSGDPTLAEFEWHLTAVPEEIPGFRPTAHIIINSRDVDSYLLQGLEEMLYGSTTAEAGLVSMEDLIAFINESYLIKIIDNGDGTWSAVTLHPELLHFLTSDLVEILQANAVYLDAYTFIISDAADLSEIPTILIYDNLDGTWTATTTQTGIINIDPDGSFEILNANAIFIGPDSYRITNSVG